MVLATMGFPGGSVVKYPPANSGDAGSIPGLGRFPGGGNGNPLQHSCLGNCMDRGAWWATVHGGHKELDITEWLHSLFLYSPTLTSIHDYWKKTVALTRWTFVSKVITAFNMLSRLVIAFLPRSKYLLISRLQSPSAVILEPLKIKSLTVSIVSPIYLPWGDGTGCHHLSFLNVEF